MKIFFAILTLIFSSHLSFAHELAVEIVVKEFKLLSDSEAVLKIENEDKVETIHIRFKSRGLASGITLEDHKPALQLLSEQFKSNPKLRVDLMSSKGYIPIKGRKGHFRCDGLSINHYTDGEKRVSFIHNHEGVESPD